MSDVDPAAFAPRIFRFSDIDEFRSSVRNLKVEFTPLVRKISAEQIILNLPGLAVNFTKSFPRIYDAQLGPHCTAVGFSMDDGIPIRFNGVDRDDSVIVIGNGGAAYSSVEQTPRKYASIIFSPAPEGRGWPETDSTFKIFETSREAQLSLRRLVLHVLSVSSQSTQDLDANLIAGAIRESLFAAVDTAFAQVVSARWATYANTSRKLRVFRDVQEALAGHIGSVIYSGELARQIGVSVRTMHDAVLQYRGMSLHRYLRLRRLWLVRQSLLAGTHSVKAAALAFGFWHMGDFSRGYRQQFGESPSETIPKSR